jgi:ABC-2 type transport system permease protein
MKLRDRLRFYRILYVTALKARTEYRADFLVGVATAVLGQSAALAFYWTISRQGGTFGEWPIAGVLFLHALCALVLGVSELTVNGIWSVPWYIASGEVDRLLVYPVNSLTFMLMSRPEAHGLGNLVTGLVLLCISWSQLALAPGLLLLLPLWVASGVAIYTSALVLLGCFCFRIVGPAGQHFWFVYQLLASCRYPMKVYPRWLQMVLFSVFPMGFATFLPVQSLVGAGSVWVAIAAALTAAAVSVSLGFHLWSRSIRLYQSTGN